MASSSTNSDVDLTVDESESSSSSSNVGNSSNQRSKRSYIHQHFTLIDKGEKYKCNYCSKTLAVDKKTGSTGNLVKHYKNSHVVATGQTTIQMNFSNTIKPTYSQAEFEKRVTSFIVLRNQPFVTAEDESFADIFKIFSETPKMMSDDTVKRRIFSRYEQEKLEIESILEGIQGKISFILDCWTSPNQIAFQGVIAQWIDKDWEFQERIIDLDILKGSHTGKNLANSFVKCLRGFNILEKIMSITTDNASNCDTFFEELTALLDSIGVNFVAGDQRVRCLAHIINLACQAAIATLKIGAGAPPTETVEFDDMEGAGDEELSDEDEEMDEGTSTHGGLCDKLRKGIMKIRGSTQRRELFKRQCEFLQIKHKELVRDVATRWNSTFYMLKRALKMKVAFEYTLRNEDKLKRFLLTDTEWRHVTEVVIFLQPFQKMTVLLSHDGLPTMALSAMVYMELYNHLEHYSAENDHSQLMVEAASNACRKLNKYYPTSDGLVYIVGLILDPRSKLTWYRCNGSYFNSEMIKKYKNIIKTCWEKNYKPSTSDTQATPNKNKKDLSDDLFSSQMKRAKVDSRDELQIYLAESAVIPTASAMKYGPLGWWKAHQDVYPNLSRMARDFLSASGTGVPVERFFSTGTDLVTPKRRKMNAETIRKTMCLRGWLRSRNKLEFKKYAVEAIKEKVLGE